MESGGSMNTLVERLNAVYAPDHEGHATRQLCEEAAAEIKNLLDALHNVLPFLEADLADAFPQHNPASPLSFAVRYARDAIARVQS
jgi:hypothetical protein